MSALRNRIVVYTTLVIAAVVLSVAVPRLVRSIQRRSYLRDLESPDSDRKRAGLEGLSKVGTSGTVPFMKVALLDDDIDVRVAAAKTLRELNIDHFSFPLYIPSPGSMAQLLSVGDGRLTIRDLLNAMSEICEVRIDTQPLKPDVMEGDFKLAEPMHPASAVTFMALRPTSSVALQPPSRATARRPCRRACRTPARSQRPHAAAGLSSTLRRQQHVARSRTPPART